MVAGSFVVHEGIGYFQYSLCRVVLMVISPQECLTMSVHLSVLALSSRFDGQVRKARPG